jgi:hypothetical protein
MKLLRTSDATVVFSLSRPECDAFEHVLGLYPVVPAAHQSLSQSLPTPQAAEAQQLLNEALAEQRSANRRQLNLWLARNRPKPTTQSNKTSARFTLRRTEAEWLLQVLNDVRVGCWLKLGSPAEPHEPGELDEARQAIWAAMEVSGMFQMALLHAIGAPPPA